MVPAHQIIRQRLSFKTLIYAAAISSAKGSLPCVLSPLSGLENFRSIFQGWDIYTKGVQLNHPNPGLIIKHSQNLQKFNQAEDRNQVQSKNLKKEKRKKRSPTAIFFFFLHIHQDMIKLTNWICLLILTTRVWETSIAPVIKGFELIIPLQTLLLLVVKELVIKSSHDFSMHSWDNAPKSPSCRKWNFLKQSGERERDDTVQT